MNKVWQKPKLIILYRGRPEESVLAICKTFGLVGKEAVAVKNNDCTKNGCPGCDAIVDT